MKAADLRIKTDDELKDQLVDLKKEALNLRFQKASGQLEATARVREVRRDIARVLSVMNEKQQKTASQE
jgi:large subunit ribosomal protein L29